MPSVWTPARVRTLQLVLALYWVTLAAWQVYEFAANKSARVFSYEVVRSVLDPVTRTYDDVTVGRVTPVVVMFGFAVITAIFHMARFVSNARGYHAVYIARTEASQFAEYAGSASLMLLAIAVITGVRNVDTLALMLVSNAGAMLLGAAAQYAFARHARRALSHGTSSTGTPRRRRCARSWGWVFFGISTALWLAAWVPTAVSFFGAVAAAAESVPDFVWSIWIALFALHTVFVVIFIFRARVDSQIVCQPADREVSDSRLQVAYAAASATAKTVLVALVVYARYQLSAAYVDAQPDLAVTSGYSELAAYAFVAGGYAFVALLLLRVADYSFRPALDDIANLSGPLGNYRGLLYLAANFVPTGWVMYAAVYNAGEQGWGTAIALALYIGTQALYVPAYEDVMLVGGGIDLLRWGAFQVLSILAFVALVVLNYLAPIYAGNAMPWYRWVEIGFGVLSFALQTAVDGIIVLRYMYARVGRSEQVCTARIPTYTNPT